MLHVVDHPVVADRLTQLRDSSCPPEHFRRLVGNVARLMVPAVTAGLETRPKRVRTPLEEAFGSRLARPTVIVPILRAGLSMMDGFLEILPDASIAHLGLARNEETLRPETYYRPADLRFEDAEVIVVDPMLATGGSAAEALSQLKVLGATRLTFVCLIAAPEGVAALEAAHPDVPIFTAAMDRELDDNAYIRPGLGDAGDRAFGTC